MTSCSAGAGRDSARGNVGKAGAGRDGARGNSGKAGAAQDSVRGGSGQVNKGAASKGHSAAGRAGQSRMKQEHASQPAPDSSDAGSMELPSPAKQEADTKPEPEVSTLSLALNTLLDTPAWLPDSLPAVHTVCGLGLHGPGCQQL